MIVWLLADAVHFCCQCRKLYSLVRLVLVGSFSEEFQDRKKIVCSVLHCVKACQVYENLYAQLKILPSKFAVSLTIEQPRRVTYTASCSEKSVSKAGLSRICHKAWCIKLKLVLCSTRCSTCLTSQLVTVWLSTDVAFYSEHSRGTVRLLTG